MITPELQNYIRQARVQGLPESQIRQNLLSGGWNDVDISEAFASLQVSAAASSPVPAAQASAPQTPAQPQPAAPAGASVNPPTATFGAPYSAPRTINPVTTAPTQNKSSPGLIVSILIILLFFAGGIWGGYAYYKNLWPFAEEKIVEETVLKELEEIVMPPLEPEQVAAEETPESVENPPALAAPVCATEFGVIGWYAGDGNAKDIKNGNDGVVKGGVKYVAGKVEQAFGLNGTDAYIEAPSSEPSWGNDPTSSGSLSAWVKFNTLPSASHIMQIIGKGSDGKDFDLQVNKDNLFRFYVGAGTNVASKTVVKTGVWYHVAGTWDATGLKMYVNGVLENTNPIPNKTRTASGQKLEIGRQPYFPGRYFNGVIDEAMISNRSWSAAEVSKMYKAGSVGVCKPAPTNP